MINSVKRQPTYRVEEMFANHASDKGLISQMCKDLLQLISKKIKNWQVTEQNRHFSKAEQTLF